MLSRAHPYNTLASCRDEFAALEAFSAAVEGRPELSAPRPIELYEEHWAFLMTFVDGQDIDSFMGRRLADGSALDTLARSIIGGLGVYYGAAGGVFGDFHPGNVLVRTAAAISLIDPSAPDPFVAEVALRTPFAPLAADLGVWAYAVAVTIIPELRTGGRLPLNRLRLTSRLVQAGTETLPVTDRPAFVRAVYAAAAAHVQKMIDTCGPKERVLGRITFRVLDWMERASLRRLGRA